ncbi:MAG: serine/threonine-protein kinase [Planctomycetota bacterium]
MHEHARADLSGTVIGHYHLIERLGSGAMGTVYRARDADTTLEVAVKVLAERFGGSPDELEQFLEEAQLSIQLDHPNIVKGLEVGEYEGVYFYAMEYIKGWTLEDAIGEHGPFNEDVIIQVGLQMALAMEAADAAGLVHKDIKPGNILLTMDHLAHIGDFGLAAFIRHPGEADGKDQLVSGTPHYMSPEQARGRRDLDIRSDIYSLGITLFQMATGKLPFDGPDLRSVMIKQITGSVPDAHDWNPAVSAALGLVVRTMMAKDRTIRYQTPQELQEELHHLMMGKELLATADGRKRNYSGAILRNQSVAATLTRSIQLQKRPLRLTITVMTVVIIILAANVVWLALAMVRDRGGAAAAPVAIPSVPTVPPPVRPPAFMPLRPPPGDILVQYTFIEDFRTMVTIGREAGIKSRECVMAVPAAPGGAFPLEIQVQLYRVLRHDERYTVWIKYSVAVPVTVCLDLWVSSLREHYVHEVTLEGGEEFKAFAVPLEGFHCAGDPGRNLRGLSMDVLADNLNCRIRSAAGGSDLQFYMDELVIVGSH